MSENGHMTQMTIDVIETTDENGQVHIFEKVEEYEWNDQRYALLIYQGDDEEESDEDTDYDEEIVVMRIVKDDDVEVFEAIDDEDEFQGVVKMIEASGFSNQPDFDFELMTEDDESDKSDDK